MYVSADCVVLARKNFNEADRILTIYTKEFGKLACIAKGVRKPTSKKAGHVEPGNWCKVFIAKGKHLDLLTEAQLKKAFGTNKPTPGKTGNIFHLLELVNQLTEVNQKNSQVFSLLVEFLDKVDREDDFNLVSAAFKIKLLSTLGFFSAKSFKGSQTQGLIKLFEEENYTYLKENLEVAESSYLKLLAFLDSMIESFADTKLKTARFTNGKF